MCEKPKVESEVEDSSKEKKPRSYYYDDAHGYEDFDPGADELDADEDEESA